MPFDVIFICADFYYYYCFELFSFFFFKQLLEESLQIEWPFPLIDECYAQGMACMFLSDTHNDSLTTLVTVCQP